MAPLAVVLNWISTDDHPWHALAAGHHSRAPLGQSGRKVIHAEVLLSLAAAMATYLALALLALSQEEHWTRAGMPPVTKLPHHWRHVTFVILMLAGALHVEIVKKSTTLS